MFLFSQSVLLELFKVAIYGSNWNYLSVTIG